MENNIGIVDRYVRLTAGLLALGAGVSMRRQSPGRTVLMSLGAMKVAEGVTGWCPLIQLAQAATQQATSEPAQQTAQGQESAPASRSEANKTTRSAEGSRHSGDEQQSPQAHRRVRAVRKRAVSGQTGHTHDGRTHQNTLLQ